MKGTPPITHGAYMGRTPRRATAGVVLLIVLAILLPIFNLNQLVQ
ncbi:MAG: hypothetical protein AB1651_12940 [Pseudomonadota bacterium]